MKKTLKIAALILVVMLGSLVFVSCNKKQSFYQQYFNNFASQPSITKAVSKINLSQGVSVFSYDSVSDVFVTKKLAHNQYASGDDDPTMVLYGFTTLEKELISPIYSNVISIKGDYAIVTKPYLDRENSQLQDIIGVVKFRGENAGDKTDFTNLLSVYNPAFNQFMFVGDYIAVPGIKAYPTVSVNYTTFYEYKPKDKLLEVFKVRCDYSYDMVIYDEVLVAIGKGIVYFFSPNNIQQNGFLQIHENNSFKAFPEDVDNEYTDNISIQISYIGNGWFIRSSRLESDIAFQGYNLTYIAYDAGSNQGKTMYALVRTNLFNFYTKSTRDNDWLLVDSVANKYSRDAYAYSTDALNNLAVASQSGYEYYLPTLNPAQFIKDGYSIVYFYYTPYVEWGDYTYEVSFCIMDANGVVTRATDALMPLAFVDGIGVQNVDPTYQSLFGSLQYIDYNDGKKVELKQVEEGENSYETYFTHNGVVIGTQMDFADNTAYFGAVDAKSQKGVLPFIYDELTPFYGKYAMGLKSFENTKSYFRLDDAGNETLIKDVVNIKHGVYVYSYGGKLGVKNYGGDTLITASYDKLEVYDVFTGNKFQTTFAIATSGNNTYIFTLE